LNEMNASLSQASLFTVSVSVDVDGVSILFLMCFKDMFDRSIYDFNWDSN
jgi:hypothetical protein